MKPMTSRERILAAIRFEEVDRVPVSPGHLGLLAPDSEYAQRLIKSADPFIYAGCEASPFFGKAMKMEQTLDGSVQTRIYARPKEI